MNGNTPLFFHIGLPKTGTTTIQHIVKSDARINTISTRHFNRFEYWEKRFDFIQSEKVNLITEENQILQTADFGKFILFLSRVKQFSPDAHIILTIREQRDLLESRYKYQFNWHGGYTKSFEDWLRSGQGMDYLSICMYGSVYEAMLSFFPADQIHILLFEDLKTNFIGFFNSLYDILGLPFPEDLIREPVAKNTALSEPELLFIRRLNRFKLCRGDQSIAKYEFALYKKIASMVKDNQKKCLEFRWDQVQHHKDIEHDFSLQNGILVNKKVITAELLRKYNYLLST